MTSALPTPASSAPDSPTPAAAPDTASPVVDAPARIAAMVGSCPTPRAPRRIAVVLALVSLGACASPAAPRSPATDGAAGDGEPALAAASVREPTLYDELGGELGVHALVEQFIRAIAADERIRDRYRHTDIARFHRMVGLQMCAFTGGGCDYPGDSMHDVHHGMQIHPLEFNAIVEALMTAMEARRLPMGTQNRLLAIYAPLRDDIIDH